MKITRSAREGTSFFFDVILLLGIFIAAQYVIFHHPHEWDFTKNRQFSLSQLSKNVLSQLKEPMEMWVFANASDRATSDLVHEYTVVSSNLKVHFVDPNAQPAKAKEFGINSVPPVIALVYGKNQEQVAQPDENRLTNAINRLVEGKTRVVYFLQGHGEPDPDSGSPDAYSSFRDALKSENFVFNPLFLAKEKGIPGDASALVIVNPSYSFAKKEKEWLADYLQNGGRVFFLCGMNTSNDALLFLKSFGVAPESNLVVDSSMQILGGGPEFLVVNNYGTSPITQPFQVARTPTPVIFPLSRGFAASDKTVAPLVSTTNSGKAFPVKLEGKKALINFKNPSRNGAIPVAVVATIASGKEKNKTGRLVVVGSSYFADNQWFGNYANRDFALNAVSWLAESQDTIAIHPRPNQNEPLMLDEKSGYRLFLLSVIALPGFGIVLGVVNWLSRRF